MYYENNLPEVKAIVESFVGSGILVTQAKVSLQKSGLAGQLLKIKDQYECLVNRGAVDDTRLEAKAKDTKKIRGQGQPFRGQTLSKPRTGMLEAKAKDQGHRCRHSPKKNVFKNFFLAISNSLAYPEFWIEEGLNHKSHEMTSSKFFQRGSFCRTKIS